MLNKSFKTALVATAGLGAMFAGLSVSPAAAAPVFEINPNVLTSGGYTVPNAGGTIGVPVSDFQGNSNALVRCNTTGGACAGSGGHTLTETLWVQATALVDNGTIRPTLISGRSTEGDQAPSTSIYNLYITGTGSMTGAGCGYFVGATCSFGAGAYSLTLFADKRTDDVFTNAATNGVAGTTPSVSNPGGNDVILAKIFSVSGNTGLQGATLAPTFNLVATFAVCDGTADEGFVGGTKYNTLSVVNLAAGCGTFDARTYFVAPTPFFSINLTSITAGSGSNTSALASGSVNDNFFTNSTVQGNFVGSIPEPSTLSLFGMGLMGLGGMFMRRRQKVAQAA